MITLNKSGEALKSKIKGERVSENYLMQQVAVQQEKYPLDYMEVIGMLTSPFVGCLNVQTLDNAITDLTTALVEILTEKDSLQVAAKSPTFTKSLGAVLTFLNRLQKISAYEGENANDHIWTLANLWDVQRWDELSPESKELLLDMYGTTEGK